MFDTNVYNDLLDGTLNIETLPKAEYFCTFEQFDELIATKREERRKSLLATFRKIDPVELYVETLVLENGQLDHVKLGNGEIYYQVLQFLDKCKKKDNNFVDALIAEVASENGLVLVTSDKCLLDACVKCNISAFSLEDWILLKKLNNQ